LISFPNCKINLGLNILRKRNDGFHDLETVFYPLPLKDAIEIIKGDALQNEEISFTSSGLVISGDVTNNLCIKAFYLLKKDFPQLPKIKMHLNKAIPMGAGLGGGSADGAFVLKLLNEKFQLGLTIDKLIEYALQLGSDCPFFMLNEPCFAQSRGEIMQPLNLNLSSYHFAVVNPGIHIGTGWAFSHIKPFVPSKSIREIIRQPIETWRNELVNDFEKPVLIHYPKIGEIKNQLYQSGALYASMTGSGSTVFAIFPENLTPSFSFPPSYIYHFL